MNDLIQRLRERKLMQWALAYAAAAFALLQGADIVAQRFAWPAAVMRSIRRDPRFKAIEAKWGLTYRPQPIGGSTP